MSVGKPLRRVDEAKIRRKESPKPRPEGIRFQSYLALRSPSQQEAALLCNGDRIGLDGDAVLCCNPYLDCVPTVGK